MGVVALQANRTFLDLSVLFDFVSELREASWLADKLAMTVHTLPDGISDHEGIGDLFLVPDVISQRSVAAFT